MKKIFWLFFGMMISASLLAQTNTTQPPGGAAEPPPAKKNAAPKKTVAKKSSAADDLKTVPLVAGPATVEARNVNIRGRAGLIGEVIGRVTKGDAVTVIEEVKLKKSKPDEPSAWAKIQLPTSVHAWVNASFIDAEKKTVKPKKLNLRGGPGENYSVLGVLQRGDTVKEIETKGDWTEIEAPPNAYAFMAAQYLKQEAPAPVPVPVEPVPTPTPIVEVPPVVPVVAPTEPPAVSPIAAMPTEPPVVAPPVKPVIAEPPPKRIVDREGLVRGTLSIQAPTPYELISIENHKVINYLYTTSTNLDMSRYKGLHIIVTGEEGMDERWHNAPVITIQRIQVLD